MTRRLALTPAKKVRLRALWYLNGWGLQVYRLLVAYRRDQCWAGLNIQWVSPTYVAVGHSRKWILEERARLKSGRRYSKE